MAMTAELNDGQTRVMPNKNKYPNSKLQEVINVYESKIKILKHLQSQRTQKYIVIVTDDREHLDYFLGQFDGNNVVDVLSVQNMKITTVFSTIVKHPKYGKGTIFVFSGGTRDILESTYLSDCLKVGCETPVPILTLPSDFYDIHYLIRKSLNLHFGILHSTKNDVVLFCGILPVSTKHHNDYNIQWRVCECIHSVSQIPIVDESKYRMGLRMFNDFTKYHAQTLGYEPWDLEIYYFRNRSEAIFLPNGYHLNVMEEIRRANIVKLLCEGIFPDAFTFKVPLPETGHPEKGLRNEGQTEAVECFSSVCDPRMKSVKYIDEKLQRIGSKFQPQFDKIMKLQENRVQNSIVIYTDERDFFDVDLVGVDVRKVPSLKLGLMALSEVKKHPKFGAGTLFVFSSGIHDLLHSSCLVECLNNKCALPQNVLTLPSNNSDPYYLIKKALQLHLEILSTSQNDTALFCGIIPVSVDSYNEYAVGTRPCISNHTARHVMKGNFQRYKNFINTIMFYNYFIKHHAQTLGYQPWNIEQKYFENSREFNFLKIDCYNITNEGNFERSNRIKELCMEILRTKSTRSTMLDTSPLLLKSGIHATSQNFRIRSHSGELYNEPIIYLNYEKVVIITDSRYLPFLQRVKRNKVQLMVEENIEMENLKDFLWRKRTSLTARTLYLLVVGIHSVAKTGPSSICQNLDCLEPLESLESWNDSELTKFTPEYSKKLKHLFKKSNSFIPRHSYVAILPPVPVSLICESLAHEDLHLTKSRFPSYKILQKMSMISRLYPEWVHKFTRTAISSIIACTCVERSSFNKLKADNGKMTVMECNADDSPLYCVWTEVVNEVVEVALKNSGSRTRVEKTVHSKQRPCREIEGSGTFTCSLKVEPQTSICEVENVAGTHCDKASDPVLTFRKSLEGLNFNDSDKRYFNDSVTRIFEEFASLLNKSKEGNTKDFEKESSIPIKPQEIESMRKSDKVKDSSLSSSSLRAKNNLNKVNLISKKKDCEANTIHKKKMKHPPQSKVVFIGRAASLELLPTIDFCSVSKWYKGDIMQKEKLSVKIDKLNHCGWKEVTFVFISDLRMLDCHENTSTCLLRKCKRPLTQIKASEFCRSDKYDKINVIKFIIENAIKIIRKFCRFVPKFIITPFTPFINVQISSEFSNPLVHSEMHDYVACLNNVFLVPKSNQPRWKELLFSFAKEWNEFSINEANEDPVVKKGIKSFISENGNPVVWKEFSSKEHNFSESGLLIKWKALVRWVVRQACKESSKPLIRDKILRSKTTLKKKIIENAEVEKRLKNSGSTLQNKPRPKSPKIRKADSIKNSSAKKLLKKDSINVVSIRTIKKELLHDSLIPLSVSDSLAQSALASSQYEDKDLHILNPVIKEETEDKVLAEPVTTAAGSHPNMDFGDYDSSFLETNLCVKDVKSDFIFPNVIYQSLETKGDDLSKLDIKISDNMLQNATSTTLNEKKNEIMSDQSSFLKSESITQEDSMEIKEEKYDFEQFCENIDPSDSLFQALHYSTIKDEEFLKLASPLPVLQADNSKETIQISSIIKAEPSKENLSLREEKIGAINSPNLNNYIEANFGHDHLVVIGNSTAQNFLDAINFFSASHWKFDNLDKLLYKIIGLNNNFKSVLFVIFCDISMVPASTKTNSTITNVQHIISTIYQYCCTKRKVVVSPFNEEVALREIVDSKLDKIWELSVLSFSEDWKKLICQAKILENLFLNDALTSKLFPINWNNLWSLDSSNQEAEALVTPFNPGSSIFKCQQTNSLTEIKHENTKRCDISSNCLGDMPEENVMMAHTIPSMAPPVHGVYRIMQKRSRSKSPDSFSFKKFKTAITSSSLGGATEEQFTLPCSDFTPAVRDKIRLELFEKFTARLKATKRTFEGKYRIYKMMPEKYPLYEKYYEVFDKGVKENGNEQQKEYLWKNFWETNFEAIKRDDWQIEVSRLKREFEDFVNPADPNCQSILHSSAALQSPISLPYNSVSLLPHSFSFDSFSSYLPPSPPLSLPPTSPYLPLQSPSLPFTSPSLPESTSLPSQSHFLPPTPPLPSQSHFLPPTPPSLSPQSHFWPLLPPQSPYLPPQSPFLPPLPPTPPSLPSLPPQSPYLPLQSPSLPPPSPSLPPTSPSLPLQSPSLPSQSPSLPSQSPFLPPLPPTPPSLPPQSPFFPHLPPFSLTPPSVPSPFLLAHLNRDSEIPSVSYRTPKQQKALSNVLQVTLPLLEKISDKMIFTAHV